MGLSLIQIQMKMESLWWILWDLHGVSFFI